MYVHGRRMGLRPDEFWSLTLREYSRECAAFTVRQRDTYNRDITQAWQTIRYLKIGWQKRLPNLQAEWLMETPARGPVRQTPSQMRDALALIGSKIGMKPRPISPAALAAIRKN
jgi:hypothetical protein